MFAINFYSPLYEHMLIKGRKTVTVRLGNKSHKYRAGELVWVTVGPRFSPRRKLFTAIIDSVAVKTLQEVSPREIDHENPEIRTHEELCELLGRIYDRIIAPQDTVTVIHFSQVREGLDRRG